MFTSFIRVHQLGKRVTYITLYNVKNESHHVGDPSSHRSSRLTSRRTKFRQRKSVKIIHSDETHCLCIVTTTCLKRNTKNMSSNDVSIPRAIEAGTA